MSVRVISSILIVLGVGSSGLENAQRPAGVHAQPSTRPAVIVLDPGHPSERNDGAKVTNGISEVHANWLVAVRLRALLRARGTRVVMTKQRERQFVANRERAEIANRSHADLFLRLHCDSGRGSGFAVYYPDRQGRAFGNTGPAASVIEASKAAAEQFHTALVTALGGSLTDNGVKGDSKTFVGGKQGALTGSILSHVPVITVEMCVLDNGHDVAFIKSKAGREKLARALADAVDAVERRQESDPAGNRPNGAVSDG